MRLESSSRDYVVRFLSAARANPEAIAIKAGKDEISYRQLESLVRRYAAAFATCGAARILIALNPGIDVYAAILGSSLAGCAHTPLNLGSPPEKMNRIAQLLMPEVIVSENDSLRDETPGATLIRPSELSSDEYEGDGVIGRLAYILFTSGTTGLPKGVMISRDALSHYVDWLERDLACRPGDRVAQHPNLAFDISMTDIFGALCFGATLVPLMSEGDRFLPARFIAREKITVWNSTPSVMSLIMQAGEAEERFLSSVRLFNFCGEPLLQAHLEAIFRARPEVMVHNTYGPTEATISVTNMKLTAANCQGKVRGSVTIGPPIDGMQLHLVGGAHADEGEVIITGPQLAERYLDDPVKTAERFFDLAIDGQMIRGYRTGDWAERHDGLIYFKERMDFQVKIRGHRIELDEVAAAFRALGWPMVIVFPEENNGALAAVVEHIDGRQFDEKGLKRQLAGKLEAYAVPQHIRLIDRLPRNENDKVDRKATIAWYSQPSSSVTNEIEGHVAI